MQIIGRAKEQAILKRCFESKKPEFIAIYGRRRVGKTFLVREFFRDNLDFFMTGASGSSMKQQIELFKNSYRQYCGPCGAIANWFEAFEQLRTFLKQKNRDNPNKKLVVFFDELPWLAAPKSDFLPALEYFWNDYGSFHPEILLIVCGSATSWITTNIIRNHGGLHNRLTCRIPLQPFTLAESEKFLQANGIRLSRMQIAELYMTTGGIPYYLGYAQPGLSTAQIIDKLFFETAAPLASEFNELYASLFKNPQPHLDIIAELSKNSAGMTQKELSDVLKKKSGGSFSKALSELEECGFIGRMRDFTKKKNGCYYKLIDFYTLFYLKHVKDNAGHDSRFWQNSSLHGEQLAWNGLAFERLCLSHLENIKNKLGISGVVTHASAWRIRPSTGLRGAQIDLVIDRADWIVDLFEIKYSGKKYHITQAYDSELREKAETFKQVTGTNKTIHIAMITTFGIDETSYRGEVQAEITLDDLFKDLD